MIDKTLSDKIKIKVLLETYSISEISNAFVQIDNKLISLHQCSADDFLRLNHDFKNLFNNSKVISENVEIIFDLFNADRNKELYFKIKTFYDQLKTQTEIFDQKISLTMEFLEELSNKLRFVFFPIKNFSQNLMSLKYLMANLNLTLSMQSRILDSKNYFKSVEDTLNNLKLLAETISKSLNHLRKLSKISHSNFLNVKKDNDIKIEVLLSNVKSRINGIEKKYTDNKDCIPKIRRKTEKSAYSISDIIKKLQYQDIIKQKMEHIQKTHKELINELIHFENSSDDEKHINDRAKFFLRIRDIAGLQAVQLIQANKEYQSALEIIVNNFMEIGDNMQVISEMCGNVNSIENDDELALFNEINDQILITENQFKSKLEQNSLLKNELSLIKNQLEQAEDYFIIMKSLIAELKQNLNSYSDQINEQDITDVNIQHSLNQVKNLHSEIEINAANFDEVLYKLGPIKKRIQSFTTEYTKLDFKADFNEIKEIVLQLYQFRKNAELKLNENQKISKAALSNIKKSISAIKYYDFFENIIEEIISELNTINYNLKTNSDASDNSIEENLNMIKKHYTVETEHKIHNQLIKGENIVLDMENDADGEIEFF